MKQKVFWLLLSAVLILSSCGTGAPYKVQKSSALEESSKDFASEGDVNPSDADEASEEDKIYAQIDGEVVNPGVYELEIGDRVFSLIEKAGGLTEDALISSINMAAVVEDGTSYHVLNKDAVAKDGKTGLININTADKDALMSLSGIGESKADAIIKFREANGAFKSVDDLLNVPGIKESTLSKIKDKVIV